MYNAGNEKWAMTKSVRNKTTKSGKNENTRKGDKL